MRNLVSTEKMLKHWLKKKVTITTATVVVFLLMGTAAFGEEIENKKEYTIEDGQNYSQKISSTNGKILKKLTNNGTFEIEKKEEYFSVNEKFTGIELQET